MASFQAFVSQVSQKPLSERFSSLNQVSLSAPGLSRKEYSDEALYEDHQYYDLRVLGQSDLARRCAKFKSDMIRNDFSEGSIVNMLAVASNLLHPGSREGKLQHIYSAVLNEWAVRTIRPESKPQNLTLPEIKTPEHSKNVPRSGKQKVDQKPPAVSYNSLFPLEHQDAEPTLTEEDIIGNEDTPVLSVAVMKETTFIAAFLFRMIMKASDKTYSAWNTNLSARFEKWYGWKVATKNPGESQLRIIKNKLDDNAPVKNSWTLLVALRDEDDETSDQALAINRYLGVTPLSYGGMQIQSFFMQCWHATKIAPSLILQKMYSPMTRAAVIEVHYICDKFELKEGQRTSKLFRYSRIIEPQYFPGMQSKESPVALAILIYLLAKVSSNVTPEDLIVISTMSLDLKSRSKEAASRIFAEQYEGQEGEYSSVMKSVFSKTFEDDQDDQDEDYYRQQDAL